MISNFSLHMYAKIGLATGEGESFGPVSTILSGRKVHMYFLILISNASHSNSRELFVVGGRHTHTRGPGLFAGDRYLGILHHQCNQTPLIVQSEGLKFQWQVSIILAMTPINAPFSKAAATRSLSASCLLTSSPVLCVPSLIRTSIRNLEGRDCSKRTRTPRPMTVARLQ